MDREAEGITMFYGYNSKEEMEAANPLDCHLIIKGAIRTKTKSAATRGKQCVGCWGGIYRYTDGTQDSGEPFVLARAEWRGDTFMWVEHGGAKP